MALARISPPLPEDSMPQERINTAHKRLTQAFDRLERAVKINRLRGVSLSAEKEKLQVALNDLQQQYNTLLATTEEVTARLDSSLAAIEAELEE